MARRSGGESRRFPLGSPGQQQEPRRPAEGWPRLFCLWGWPTAFPSLGAPPTSYAQQCPWPRAATPGPFSWVGRWGRLLQQAVAILLSGVCLFLVLSLGGGASAGQCGGFIGWAPLPRWLSWPHCCPPLGGLLVARALLCPAARDPAAPGQRPAAGCQPREEGSFGRCCLQSSAMELRGYASSLPQGRSCPVPLAACNLPPPTAQGSWVGTLASPPTPCSAGGCWGHRGPVRLPSSF